MLSIETQKLVISDGNARSVLHDILKQKRYNKENNEWVTVILPNVMALIDALTEVANRIYISDKTDQEILKELINLKVKISERLLERFSKEPPFTILRLAELLYRPLEEGYKIDGIEGIIKYFHAILKVISVTHSVLEGSVAYVDDTKDAKCERYSMEISLVEIPWLKDTENALPSRETKNELKDDSGIELMLISPTTNGTSGSDKVHEYASPLKQSDLGKIERRRKGQNGLSLEPNENSNKRAKRQDSINSSPMKSPKEVRQDEGMSSFTESDSTDNMDVSENELVNSDDSSILQRISSGTKSELSRQDSTENVYSDNMDVVKR